MRIAVLAALGLGWAAALCGLLPVRAVRGRGLPAGIAIVCVVLAVGLGLSSPPAATGVPISAPAAPSANCAAGYRAVRANVRGNIDQTEEAGTAVVLKGWMTGAPRAVTGVCALVDGRIWSNSRGTYGGSRPDVAALLHDATARHSAFSVTIEGVPAGAHQVGVAALIGGGYVVGPAPVTITIAR